jgi:hypothetical protein
MHIPAFFHLKVKPYNLTQNNTKNKNKKKKTKCGKYQVVKKKHAQILLLLKGLSKILICGGYNLT